MSPGAFPELVGRATSLLPRFVVRHRMKFKESPDRKSEDLMLFAIYRTLHVRPPFMPVMSSLSPASLSEGPLNPFWSKQLAEVLRSSLSLCDPNWICRQVFSVARLPPYVATSTSISRGLNI